MLTSWTNVLLPGLAAGGAALLWLLLAPDARLRALKPLPCPSSTLPVLGNTLDLSTQLHRLHDWILDQCILHKGKTWRLQALGAPPLVVVSSVECFEDVMKTQFEIFDKGVRMNTIFRTFVGDGIGAVDGEKWKQQRKALSRLFTMHRFRDSICGAIQRHLKIFGSVLDRAANDQATGQAASPWFPLSDAFHRFAFDTFTEIAFGLDENTLDAIDTDANNAFLTAMMDAMKLLELRFHQPDWLWQLKSKLNVGDERKLSEAMEVIDTKVYEVVNKTLERSKLNTTDTREERQDVLSIVMDHVDEFKEITTHGGDLNKQAKLLRDAGFSMIAAGKDSTGTALTWMMIMLAREPRVLQLLRSKLRAHLPQLFSDKSFVPSMDQVENHLVYLEAVVRETLRLCSLVPLNAKEANQDVTLCDGTFMKKGTRVYIPAYALARMPGVWGPDAAEFKPERWINAPAGATGSATLKTFSSFQFVAFHAGPRICLGMRFAMLELKTTLAYLLSKFDFELEKPAHSYTYEMALTLALKGDLRARVTPLQSHGDGA